MGYSSAFAVVKILLPKATLYKQRKKGEPMKAKREFRRISFTVAGLRGQMSAIGTWTSEKYRNPKRIAELLSELIDQRPNVMSPEVSAAYRKIFSSHRLKKWRIRVFDLLPQRYRRPLVELGWHELDMMGSDPPLPELSRADEEAIERLFASSDEVCADTRTRARRDDIVFTHAAYMIVEADGLGRNRQREIHDMFGKTAWQNVSSEVWRRVETMVGRYEPERLDRLARRLRQHCAWSIPPIPGL